MPASDELPVIRGKISINDTLKRQSSIRGKISCQYDELSSNVLFNQIIKTTLITLINYKELDKQIKNQLIHINRYFREIDINNSPFTGEKAGMLIYPVVHTEFDFVYSIQGKKIYVKTLNLNTKWEDIYRRLKKIAELV